MSTLPRREFLAGSVTLASGLALPLVAATESIAALDADDPEKPKEVNLMEFCAREFGGEVNGMFHYTGVGCPGEIPATHTHHESLPYPRNCGDAGCLQLREVIEKPVKFMLPMAVSTPHSVSDAAKKKALNAYVPASLKFPLRPGVAGITTHDEVCLISFGEAKPRKMKLFQISILYHLGGFKFGVATPGVGYEINPTEEIGGYSPKTYTGTEKFEFHGALVHPSGSRFELFLRDKMPK